MRKTPLIAVGLLAASTVQAQVAGDCRGETLSELNDCIAAATPPPEAAEPAAEASPLEPVQGAGTTRAPTTGRVEVGGALQPTDLRAPISRSGNAPRQSAEVGRLPIMNDAAAPERLDLPGNVGEPGREGVGTRPMTGFGYDSAVPGVIPQQ